MTGSPYLDQPKRDPDAAMFDVGDKRHRIWLGHLAARLKEESEADGELWPKEFYAAAVYAVNQLDKHAAARILERNRNG